MTMQPAQGCPQIKTKGKKELREEPCGKPKLYRVVAEDRGLGDGTVYWTISLGTPANPPELCRDCAMLDAYSRNAGQRVRAGMAIARAADALAADVSTIVDPELQPENVVSLEEARQDAQEPAQDGPEPA